MAVSSGQIKAIASWGYLGGETLIVETLIESIKLVEPSMVPIPKLRRILIQKLGWDPEPQPKITAKSILTQKLGRGYDIL